MSWTSNAAAITALRSLIKDNPTDKICSMKAVLGEINGLNQIFKTFEYRRVTNFSATGIAFPEGLYVNGTAMAASGILQDDIQSGAFQLQLAVPLANRDSLRATYYYQWFTDAELDSFLLNASDWLGLGPNYMNLPDGLNASAMRFAAQEAYLAAAMKYSTRMSEVYKLEDAPSEEILKAMEAFREMADSFMDQASKMRDDYYTRQGQSLAPNFGFSLGAVVDPTPRR